VSFPDFGLPIVVFIIASALSSALGNFLLVVASKSAEASLVAPLVYSQLFSATVAGLLVFEELPDGYAMLGLMLIAISGFGSLFIHHKQARHV
jgi:drug/metabolite transporter (DMT)-like permease